MLKITALMAVYNRQWQTLECLRSLSRQNGLGELFELSVVVLDDASTDGTVDAIRELDLAVAVEVVGSEGNLFWARGMARAQEAAVRSDPDALLWLNDDVKLDDDALSRLVSVHLAEADEPVVVGATRSAGDGSITYTGARRRSRRPGSLVPVLPEDGPVAVDAFNGNCVLVPRHVYRVLGTIDPGYEHAYGDIDYGLRVSESRIARSLLLDSSIGTCEANPTSGTWRDPAAPMTVRLRGLVGRKGYPPRSHWRFNRRHGGPGAPVYFIASYVRAVGRILTKRAIA